MMHTVFATYDNLDLARAAIADLVSQGISPKDIGAALYDADDQYQTYVEPQDMDVDGEDGATAGGAFGTVLGALVGLVSITIPGVGPVIAAGPLVAALGAATGAGIGAASGAVTGGLVGSFMNMGVPDSDAHYYAESLRRGSALVMVKVYEEAIDTALQVLQKYHPIDLEERLGEWSAEGWSKFDPAHKPYASGDIAVNRRKDASDIEGQTKLKEYRESVRRYPST